MLIACPECGRKVSDRARACPDCGFPVAEWAEEQRLAEVAKERREARKRIGEVDCPACQARGFVRFQDVDETGRKRDLFSWCDACRHSGRVHLCFDSAHYFAVSYAALPAFLAGELDEAAEGVWDLGPSLPGKHRYQQASELCDES